MTGPGLTSTPVPSAEPEATRDLDRREVGTLAPLFLALVLFGFYPMPLLNVINPYVQDTLQQVGVTDPAPTVTPAASPAQNAGGQQ
jgi:NADH-quinone oxidoreductase subunit M